MANSTGTAADTADSYDQQLGEKLHRLYDMVGNRLTGPFEVFRSPPNGYRMRAEFRVWHSGEDLHYVMFPKGSSRTPLRVEHFPPASACIQALMPVLLSHVRECPALRQKLFQVDFLSTRNDQCLVSLIYHRRLDSQWEQAARRLQSAMNIKVIGRSRKQKVVLDDDFVTEHFRLDERTLSYQQIENSFTQPNAWINESMLAWAIDVTPKSNDDLLELYCGNGNFSIAIAANFRKVLASEMDRNGIRAAKENARANKVANLELVRMSAAEVASAVRGERPFRRLSDLDLDSYRFSTLLVDPPRAGLDPTALAFAAEFDRIVYVSCNPASLAENLMHLDATHDVYRAAMFDQFPGTEHIECGVVMERRKI